MTAFEEELMSGHEARPLAIVVLAIFAFTLILGSSPVSTGELLGLDPRPDSGS